MTEITQLSPEQYEPARTLLEGALLRTKPRRYSVHSVFSALVYKLEATIPFRALPAAFPPWRSCHEMFLIWTSITLDDGRCLLEHALEACGRTGAIDELRALLGTNKRKVSSSAKSGARVRANANRGRRENDVEDEDSDQSGPVPK